MQNITKQFNSGFEPVKALLIYKFEKAEQIGQFQRTERETQVYVESYDIGRNGKPINAHPLTLKEMGLLSDLLQSSQELKSGYLKPKGVLPPKVLYVDQQANGYAVWYTPPQEVNLYFIDSLQIPCGKFHVPAMLWKASGEKLQVYAFKGKSKPNERTILCHAPYLNVYVSGQVCMGTVRIDITKTECLEDFISLWEGYFFNSNFSHSINGNNSTKSDTTQLWRTLAGTGKPFPQEELLPVGFTLKTLLK